MAFKRFFQPVTNLISRVRNLFVSEDIEELEIEDEELDIVLIDEIEEQEEDLDKRIIDFYLDDEPDIEPPDKLPIDDAETDQDIDDLEQELEDLEQELDDLEQDQEDGLTDRDIEIIDTFGFIDDEELQFRLDMADFLGVDITTISQIDIGDLEALATALIFDESEGDFSASFVDVIDLINSPIFDLVASGHADIVIDDGEFSVYETDYE